MVTNALETHRGFSPQVARVLMTLGGFSCPYVSGLSLPVPEQDERERDLAGNASQGSGVQG